MTNTTYTISIIRGTAGLDAHGEEFGLSALAGTDLPQDVIDWLDAHGAWDNLGSDVWVLVTSPEDEHPGEIDNLVAQRDVTI